MVAQVKVTGMVLATMPIGDYDKRLVILTRDRGKITAFAKGARKQNSALLACCQPFSFGEYTLYEGRTSYNVISAEISNFFIELREDLEAVSFGLYFLELAEYITTENTDESNILKLLYQTLRALIKRTIPFELIQYIYELKILSLNGEAPQAFECVQCKNTETYYHFRAENGGLLCSNCVMKYNDYIKVSGSTIYTIQYIITSSIEKLYTFTVSEEVFNELSLCMKQYKKVHLDKEFKSLEMLKF